MSLLRGGLDRRRLDSVRTASLAVVASAALALAACSGADATAPPTVTVTETQTVTRQAVPPVGEVEGQAAAQDALLAACAIVEGGEPSWDTLQEYGPWYGAEIDPWAVSRAARRGYETYLRALEALDVGRLSGFGTVNYGQTMSDLENRLSMASELSKVADNYQPSGQEARDRLMYWYGAYAASIEMNLDGCP